MNPKRLFLTLGVVLWFVATASAQTSTPPPASPAQAADRSVYSLPNIPKKQWIGDLDGMIKRRAIRILVPYSRTFYFADRGTQHGLTYEAFRLFEDDLNKKLKKENLRIHVLFEPTARDKLTPDLLAGQGDIAVGDLTITPKRLKQVDFSNPTYRNVSEIVVTGPGAGPITTAQDLSGKEVYVRRSSSFYESVEQLNAELAEAGKALVKVRFSPENLEDGDVLEMVNAGLVKITVVDNLIAEFWAKIFPNLTLNRGATLRTGGELAWMIRKDSPQLKAELNEFIARYREGSSVRKILLQKYLQNTEFAKEATSKEEIAKFESTLDFFRKYCGQYELDYLLMMAQGYQESQLNQQAKSRVGAIGVMQVMPAIGRDLKVGDIRQTEPNIHAGVKYIRFMMNHYYANEPMDELNKGLFTFASYNAGPRRIAELRKEAATRGLNPNIWFSNVEVIASEKIGRETVQYVSNIYKYYLAYQMIEEQCSEREKAKESVKTGGSP